MFWLLFILLLIIGIALVIIVFQQLYIRAMKKNLLITLGLHLQLVQDYIHFEEFIDLEQAKIEFISIVSHQLRTPLTVVKGYISMLQEGFFTRDEQTRNTVLNKVNSSTERLIKLVNDLLHVSRIESGHFHVEASHFDVGEVVDKVRESLIAKAEVKNIIFELKKEHDAAVDHCWADSDKVYEVLYNVIDNAIKYSHDGDRIEVIVRNHDNTISIQVIDYGIGLSEKDMHALFKKFSRADDNYYVVHTEGIGFGLYVCKRIMEAMSGSIEAYSQGRGHGAQFNITLPKHNIACTGVQE